MSEQRHVDEATNGGSRATTRQLALGLAGVRMGIGAALMVAPTFAGALWVGPGVDGHGSSVLARALGARDLFLGYRTLRSVLDGDEVGGWLQLGAMADAADTTAALLAYRGITGHRRFSMPLISGAMGTACFIVGRRGSATTQGAANDAAHDVAKKRPAPQRSSDG
jgi:hypothetical protein